MEMWHKEILSLVREAQSWRLNDIEIVWLCVRCSMS